MPGIRAAIEGIRIPLKPYLVSIVDRRHAGERRQHKIRKDQVTPRTPILLARQALGRKLGHRLSCRALAAEESQDPRSIVAPEEIHRGIGDPFGHVWQYLAKRVAKTLGRTACKILHKPCPQGIVHHTVKLPSGVIVLTHAVCNL